jgi:hypothetical protein
MTEEIEQPKNGMVRIIGKRPDDELLAQIKHRIGPDEAAVVVTDEAVKAWLKKTKKPRTWRNWFGLRCWLRRCPCRVTMSHEPFGWRCVICREMKGVFFDD